MKKSMLPLLFLALGVVLFAPDFSFAFSNSNGNEFQGLYNKVIGWVTGLPGIIAAIGIGLTGAWRAFSTGQFMWFFGGLLVAAIIVLLPNIITGMGFVY